ncbi:MAG: CRTAC1 family protein, partial [Gemmatimonadetes bacterium]|nr:CRTAC1 family protein [Gemmatimonadota bacterium]
VTLAVNPLVGEASQQLQVQALLRDGSTVDLTAASRGTAYSSSDLAVCNFQWESCRLLRNTGDGRFEDRTAPSGLGGPTYQTLTFGTDFVDTDNDGYPDLFLANGHVEPNIEILDSAGPLYAQHDQLFLNNRDGTYTDVTVASGLTAFPAAVGRGSAAADYDNDGDVDFFVSNNNQRPHLLRNDGGNQGNWISVEVEGTRSNRSGIGTRVTVFTEDLRQTAEVRGSSSYLSHNDLRLHFGLGRQAVVDSIHIRWPAGGSQTVVAVPAGQFLRIVEGEPWVGQ